MNRKICALHGALEALSTLCDKTDFVSIYGADEIQLSGDINKASIEKALKEGVVHRVQKVTDFKPKLDSLISKWILNRLPLKGSPNREFLLREVYKYIEEVIDADSNIIEVWLANVEGGKWEYEGEMLLICEKDFSYYLYFSWSD